MLRPNPEQTLFGYFPARLIISILLFFVVVVSVILILRIEREKYGLVVFFLLTVLGVTVFSTYQSYHTVRRTLESVKSLTRNILESIPTGVITVDSRGRITSINPAADKILLLGNEALGKQLTLFLPESTGLGQLLEEAFAEGRLFHDQTVTYPKGDQTLVLWVTLSELKNEGKREGLVLLVKDISEINRLEQQVRRSEKLSAISTLSAAVAHEIRNPLSAMDLNLGLLEEEILLNRGATPTIREYLDVLNIEIKRLKSILDSFARFSIPNPLVLEEVKLEPILQHLVTLIRGEAHEKGIEVETDILPGLPLILVDENQMTQVFLNIMINALQAMPAGGKLFIQAEKRKINSERWVNVRFSDTGAGMDRVKINKIFEPFFSTRQGGTGLGLAIAHRIIEDHGGFIHVESVEGSGTVFTVQLPVRNKEEAKKS
ncbi:MAG: PAS domain-containing protein [Nitrospirae bacterium]|nr:PAS domain-containing protein [Nitrospirota bacterium]MBI3352884.1 PAS domain-containing protein [Nitrospirota bacterium]